MAQIKISPEFLLQALFGQDSAGCLSLRDATYDFARHLVLLDLHGSGVPTEGEAEAHIIRERQTVKFVSASEAFPESPKV